MRNLVAWLTAVLALVSPALCAERVTRPQLEAFHRSLQPLVEEGRKIGEELQALQQTMKEDQERRRGLSAEARMQLDLETHRRVQRSLARMEHLVVAAASLRPAAGLVEPAVNLLLAGQHGLAALRNLELFHVSHRLQYLQHATQHRTASEEADARFKARMAEIEREVR